MVEKIGTAARREATVPTTGVATHEAITDTFNELVKSASTTVAESVIWIVSVSAPPPTISPEVKLADAKFMVLFPARPGLIITFGY